MARENNYFRDLVRVIGMDVSVLIKLGFSSFIFGHCCVTFSVAPGGSDSSEDPFTSCLGARVVNAGVRMVGKV